MSVEYRACLRADLAGQRRLFALSFPETAGSTAASEAHYRWKFEGMPATPASWQYVGAEAGTLVAYYAALPYRYRIDGTVRTAAMVCDVMTHPQWRGQGLFTAIGRHATSQLAIEGAAFTTGYPIRPEVIPGHLKVGWRVVQPLPVWVRAFGTRSLLPRALRWLSPLVDPVLRGLQALLDRPRRGDRSIVQERDAFLGESAYSPAYERFLQRWMNAVPNALVKDADFLAWRTGAPGARYAFVSVHRDDELAALALVRPTTLKGVRALAVLDIMVDRDQHGAERSLHHALSRLAVGERCDAVACMCSLDWARAYGFSRAGYLRTPMTFSLIVKPLDPAVTEQVVGNPGRWHVFWIDSDDL